MKITKEIKCCRECFDYTNSSIEHDCAFTPQPSHLTEWCRNPKRKGSTIIYNTFTEIDKNCPRK